MTVINGDSGIDTVQDGSIVDADLNLSVKPMFSAYLASAQTVSSNVNTLITINTEEFDTTNAFNTATYKFQPTKAGFYQVSLQTVGTGTTNIQLHACYIYKNGVAELFGSSIYTSVSTFVHSTSVTTGIVYLNGSTDYIQAYGVVLGAGTLTITQAKFQAHYIGA